MTELVLTFDDGPGPSTGALLDVLGKHGARATFFLLGRSLLGETLAGGAEAALALAARAAREGHLLGNHTMSHAPSLAPDALLSEVAACDGLIRDSYRRAGRVAPDPIPVRLPFGPARSDASRSLEALERLGRPHCHWSGDPRDWSGDKDATELAAWMRRHIESEWRRGETPILLLHDAGPLAATVAAVDQLCLELQSAGVRYLTFQQCASPKSRFGFRKSGGLDLLSRRNGRDLP